MIQRTISHSHKTNHSVLHKYTHVCVSLTWPIKMVQQLTRSPIPPCICMMMIYRHFVKKIHLQMTRNVEVWFVLCLPKGAYVVESVERTMESAVIWEATQFMWRHYNYIQFSNSISCIKIAVIFFKYNWTEICLGAELLVKQHKPRKWFGAKQVISHCPIQWGANNLRSMNFTHHSVHHCKIVRQSGHQFQVFQCFR